jgi:hypothetical protein
MRNMLIDALLILITASSAGSEVADLAGCDTDAFWFGPGTTDVETSAGTVRDLVQGCPAISEPAVADPDAMKGEPLGQNKDAQQPDEITRVGTNVCSFVDSVDSQVQRDALFRNLDLLRRAEIRGSPIRFGVDDVINFVDHHDNRPGFSAPLGIVYQTQPRGMKFFAQFAPIFAPAPNDSLGWGGGVGLRIFFRQ